MRWLALTLAVAATAAVACSPSSPGRPEASGGAGGTGGGADTAGPGAATGTGTGTGGIIVTGTGGVPGTGGTSGGMNASDAGPLPIPGGEITAVGGPNIVVNGVAKTVQLTATANGTPLTGTWTTADTTVGSVGADGVFHANGFVGGTVEVTILVGRGQITATITVDVDITENPAMLPAATQTSLVAGGPADPTFKFLYPFDGTVFPRGLPAPVLQFGDGITVTGIAAGADGGIVPNTANGTYLKITTSHFSYQQFGPGGTPVRVLIPEPVWKGATLSAGPNDPMKVAVSKRTGTAVTGPVTENWRIARGTLKGFIYYSTYKSPLLPNDPVTNTGGGILRIRPGATTPEIVRRGCIVCHSVSANGSVLTAAIGPDLTNPTSGDAVNLSIATPTPTPRGAPTNIGQQYAFAGLTPDGSLALTNGNPSGLPPLVPHGLLNDYQTILVNTATGAPVASPSLTQLVRHAQGPTFSPDGKHVAFVNGDVPQPQRVLSIMDFDGTSVFSNLRMLRSETETTTNGPASQGATLPPQGPPQPKAIAWPSFTADGSALVYHSGDSFDSSGFDFGSGVGISWPQYAELRLIELDGTVKKLNALNGRNANGTSVLPYGEAVDNNLDYEPTMMPLPVGGYLWLVFTSRRCYGNTWAPGRGVTTQPFDVPAMDPWGSNAGPSPRKKLWVAAIDLNHADAANLDPSHAAFYLPGQEAESANMRAFAALAPCLPEKATCESGADCCGGYCRQTGTDASGVPILQCVPPPANTCSKIDEPCKTKDDCCDATNYCIGGICSLPPPITIQ